ESDHQRDGAGHVAQEDVEMGTSRVNEARDRRFHEQRQEDIEIGVLARCGCSQVAVIEELDEGPPRVEEGEISERAVDCRGDAEACDLTDQSGARSESFPPEDRVVAYRRARAEAPRREIEIKITHQATFSAAGVYPVSSAKTGDRGGHEDDATGELKPTH